MPDVPPAPDEVAALRAANARLREVIEAKDTEVVVLRAHLEAYQAQLEELRAEVEALRARLRQNPRNSSKPPSAEGLAKPAPRSQRGKSGRKPGRPKGQPGATLELTDHPDEVVTHEPGRCAGCGAGLSGAQVTRDRAPPGDRPARGDPGAGHRAPDHLPPLRLRHGHQRRRRRPG